MAELTPQAQDEVASIVLTEVAERIGIITLNRPERRNALNGELIGALDDAVRRMAEDAEVKVVILTGAAPSGGFGGFCSGGDVKDGATGPGGERGVPVDALNGDLSRHDDHAAMRLHLMPKPTIAMVGGPAIGAGCSLAAACDLRFASEDAVFSANSHPTGLSVTMAAPSSGPASAGRHWPAAFTSLTAHPSAPRSSSGWCTPYCLRLSCGITPTRRPAELTELRHGSWLW